MSIRLPPPDLAPSVDFCWSIPRDRPHPSPFHELLPDGGVHLVIRLSASGCGAALIGPATERAAVALDPASAYLGVRFHAGLAPRLADVRAAELPDRWAPVARLAGRTVASLGDEIASAADTEARFRVLDGLLRAPSPRLVADARCRDAAALLAACGGQIQVDELARALSLGMRTLERALVGGMGIAPKRLIRLARLRRVLGALRARRAGTLAELAQACGYADQAHLTRDFRQLTGRAPGEPEAFHARPLPQADTRIVHPRR
jgi:AraC-like DNA-binding protein